MKKGEYSQKFKLEAVRLSQVSDRPLSEVASQLGLDPSKLHQWRAQFGAVGNDESPNSAALAAHEQDLHGLRQENRRLRQENQRLGQENQRLRLKLKTLERALSFMSAARKSDSGQK